MRPADGAQTSQPYLIPVRESRVPGLGPQGMCPHCQRWTIVWAHDHPFGAGRLGLHHPEKGPLCKGSHLAITLAAAIERDTQLNPEEKAADAAARRHLHGCRGPLIDDQCLHPACHRAADRGLRWTLMGWRKTDAVLF
jgi:hypothetical protein